MLSEAAERGIKSLIKGITSEYRAMCIMMELGYEVAQPMNPQARYDAMVEIEGAIYKVQIKTGRDMGTHIKGSLNTRRQGVQNLVRNGLVLDRPYQENDFSILALYDPDNDDLYIIPRDRLNEGKIGISLFKKEIPGKLYANDFKVT